LPSGFLAPGWYVAGFQALFGAGAAVFVGLRGRKAFDIGAGSGKWGVVATIHKIKY